MKNKMLIMMSLSSLLSAPALADRTLIDGMDFGPLADLVGTWKSVDTGGVDISPGQEGSAVGKGGPAVTPFYETLTFEVAADAVNASDQHLVALYYKQEVFRKEDNTKFHDQRGYFIYDAENQMVYNSFCVPRTTCVTAEGPAGQQMTLVAPERGVAESSYMTENAKTTAFTMNIKFDETTLTYSQSTGLEIYGNQFAHTDSSTLIKVQ
ncbi:heme-binding beta-barrel domain-containing protein [Vibrio sp. WXL103]|uniref:heme-binding beta-barrel domain-containing protein n=1 Tax=unclassified Vibrio TaxID=2614977 RepID=UPI003EC66F38